MRVRFRNSLAGRLVLFGVLPTLLLVGSLVALGLVEKYRSLQGMAERQLSGAARLAAGATEDRLNDVGRTARLVAESVAVGRGGRPEESAAALLRIVDRDPVVSAAWIALEPGVVDLAALPVPARALVHDGRFVPRAGRDAARGERPTVTASPDLLRSDARDRCIEAFRGRGSLEAQVGDPVLRAGRLVVEVACPIVESGELLGVAGAECAAQDIEAGAQSLADEIGASIFAVLPSGTIVAAAGPRSGGRADATSAFVGRAASETPYAPLLVPFLRRADAGSVHVEADPVTHAGTYLAAASTTTGGCKVVLMRPVREVMQPALATVLGSVAVAAAGLVLLASLLIVLAFSVRRRIDRAVRAAERIAQGDLTVRIECDGQRDEAGALLETLAVMAERLNALIARVQVAGRTLDESVIELGKSTSTQKSAATPLGNTTTEVAAAAKQISATGVELARTMESVQANAAATADLAKRGREQLSAVDGSMRELDTATSSVAGKLATINERAVAINAVVTTITKVADQTNLLSVNAAIEAEKTGEQGRGFLVVAREIRRLADQTAASTLDIARLVEEMQSAVSAGVMEMDRFAEKVRRGVEDVNETSRQMGAIIGQVAENTERFRAVTEGMASQSAGAVQISDTTSHIQQSARAAIDGLARLSGAARSIEGAARALHSEVSAFRIVEPG